MKRKVKTIVAVIIVIAIIVSVIMYSFVNTNDKSRFIGTWEEIEATSSGLADPENFSLIWTFYDNNSLKEEIVNISTGETVFVYWEIYKVEFGKLYFGPDGDRFGTPPPYYTFSDDDTKLTLTLQSDSDEYWIYSKIS